MPGVKCWSTQPGTISAICFYRGAERSQGRVAPLYSAGGTLLAPVTLRAESGPGPGWQKAISAFPVPPIAANTTYIAGHYASSGQYSDTYYGLSQTASNVPLKALGAILAENNGGWDGRPIFPTQDRKHANFFAELAFTPTAQWNLTLSVNPPGPTIPSTTLKGQRSSKARCGVDR